LKHADKRKFASYVSQYVLAQDGEVVPNRHRIA
jgi:hypothetical protein